ncbi:hypothetical protein [Paraburkholderia caballeronis]|uniref:hypothetical protein n=1 Tax=Paraburkholderia caballeronis TaxID=416943 RepID=UPI0010ED08AB|nr:hypothetical protein [Paraburkholderia caballeronis]TDV06831.1 hypothetical protein C7408_12290 [Paraburkholderia caballeronis]TDV10011.1 hypothetical protein C7406_12490 [Paraburkholderia caballeronis]TDV21843.1 hypothetical protein C7404_12090 [Paraburkholderia caballeronis]
MGAVVIAVVFVAGLIGAPSLFGHTGAHAGPQQVASATQAPPSAAQQADAEAPSSHP